MKRFVSLSVAILLSLIIVVALITIVNREIPDLIRSQYHRSYGSKLEIIKNQGIILQQVAFEQEDSIPLYGTSELSNIYNPFHPNNFFPSRGDVQVNLIGRPYCQSLIQLINIGALGSSIKSQKLALLISPQWFSEYGLTNQNFDKNFSELQFLRFMSNPEISDSVKTYAADRVSLLVEGCPEAPEVQTYIKFSANNSLLSAVIFNSLKPFFMLKSYLLNTKDLIQSYNTLIKDKPQKKYLKNKQTFQPIIDWDEEKKAAENLGKEKANNNDFYMDNKYYDQYIKDKLSEYKGYMKNSSYLQSPEYEDFKQFLRLCKELNISPLIISIPVNGRWYDYCEFSRSDRDQYYENIRHIVSSYGFELADFSGHEYDPYFLQDGMHLGWKGWVYVNEAIVAFYN